MIAVMKWLYRPAPALFLALLLGVAGSPGHVRAADFAAQLAALPTLAAPLEATCVGPDGTRAKVHRNGSCKAGSPLELAIHSMGNGTEAVHYAFITPDGARTARLETDQTVSVPLDTPGPRALGLLLSNVTLSEGALDTALAPGAGIDGRLHALDQYVAKLIDTDFHARAEALRFTVEP
jgi:hypothetical protein